MSSGANFSDIIFTTLATLVAVSTSLDSQIRIWDLEQLKQHKIIDAGASKDQLPLQISVFGLTVQEHHTH
jgi:WD40 repeat protein